MIADHEAVVNALARIQNAWVQGRPQDLPALFHKDIVLAFPGFAGAARGRRAAAGTFTDFLREAEPIGYHEQDLQVEVAGDTAVATYTFELHYRRKGSSFRSTGRDLWVFTRHAGAWLATWRTLLNATEDALEGDQTRSHIAEVAVAATPEAVFDALITPSAVRQWWSASRVIVTPEVGGLWVATWGEDEDRPDYVSAAPIERIDPPRNLRLGTSRYVSRDGPLPFEADMRIEFTVRPAPAGAVLRVEQSGFPRAAAADDYYAACERGWKETLAQLKEFVEGRATRGDG